MEQQVPASAPSILESKETTLRRELGLDEEWTFVPKTDGFVKSEPCQIPEVLQKVYDEQNSHTK